MRRSTIMMIAFIVFGFIVLALFCLLSGCEMLAQFGTDPNGTVLIDPNQVGALVNAGHAVKSIGIATGNPELIGIGILIITIAGTIGGVALKRVL